MVIFLNDALGKGESESPTTLLGGKTWTENVGEVFLADALTGVAHLDDGKLGGVFDMEGDGARFALHRVDGIL